MPELETFWSFVPPDFFALACFFDAGFFATSFAGSGAAAAATTGGGAGIAFGSSGAGGGGAAGAAAVVAAAVFASFESPPVSETNVMMAIRAPTPPAIHDGRTFLIH
ncbi:MAG: hypothetical protein JWM74_3952, partial [Myxococcaceae bacterium]|nr:hypothetical protein [Myxococcaceae bacterium]